jgi:[ribosomal protein S18]-alanine N-acetyltransferase
MRRSDLPSVLLVDSQYPSEQWTEDDFFSYLRQRHCIGMVAELDGQIVGLMVYEIFKLYINVKRFRVHPDFTRRGIGRAMMESMIGKLSFQGRNRVRIDVPESYLDGHLFLKAMGFEAVGVLDDRYRFVYRAKDESKSRQEERFSDDDRT